MVDLTGYIDDDEVHILHATALAEAVDRHLEGDQENWDSLGISASIAGTECLRSLWYTLRWVKEPEVFEAKTLRIFETGNIWEDRIVRFLKATCENVWEVDQNGRQFKATLVHGWVRGKVDAVVKGVPGLDPEETLGCEMKSANKSNFNRIAKHGVRKGKLMHFVQLQLYLRYFGFARGLYVCACKDDERLHFEIIERDDAFLHVLLNNIENTVRSNFAPPRISEDPESFLCRFCDHIDLCHHGKAVERRTCRTCVHATPAMGSKLPSFDCVRHGMPVGPDDQKLGCASHLFLPELTNMEQIDVDEVEEVIKYRAEDGTVWIDLGGTGPLKKIGDSDF
ncbi:hypothetical protein [Sulfitobacter sp. 1A15106]|uniref:hypothetical protein n=1 Tax=Sulfitobacter sp. 1A15106 TaxID=3368590 RepID=UPI0037472D54